MTEPHLVIDVKWADGTWTSFESYWDDPLWIAEGLMVKAIIVRTNRPPASPKAKT